jgi:hypothetical protein
MAPWEITGERVWQQAQPFAQQAVDLVGRETIADFLQACRIGTTHTASGAD